WSARGWLRGSCALRATARAARSVPVPRDPESETRPFGKTRSDSEESAGVAVEHLLLIFGRQWHRLHPAHPGRILHVRVVHRKQDVVDAHFEYRAQQRGCGEVAAGGDVEVVAERLFEADVAVARPVDGLVDTV